MSLFDFFPQLKDWQEVHAAQSQRPSIPDPQTQSTPTLRAPLPLPLQYSPDSLKQYNRPGLSSFRTPPIPASGQPVVNSAASSVTQTTVIETVQVSAAGPSGAIQFNSGGVLGGVAQLEWNNVGSVLTLIGSAVITGNVTLTGSLTAAVYNATTGFQVGGLAPAGEYLRGNGTDFVASAILAGDVPTLNQNTTGTAANLSGNPTVSVTAIAIPGAVTAGHYLRNNGTNFVDSAIQVADVPTLNQNTTGTAANLSGTPALPNGTTATTQSPGDNSTKLATTAYVDAASASFAYGGDGSDSSVTFDGSSTVLGLVPSASAYTMTRDIFITTGTVNIGVTLNTNGFVIFATISFTNNGTTQNNGGNGGTGGNPSGSSPGGAAGAAGTNAGSATGHYAPIVASNAGGIGGIGSTGNGSSGAISGGGVSGNSPVNGGVIGSAGGTGGTGGNGGTGTGGGARTPGSPSSPVVARQIARNPIQADLGYSQNGTAIASYTLFNGPSTGGAGGAGGGGDGVNAGGAGGGSGGCGGTGGMLAIFARTISNTGTIQANGGAGGTGGAGFTPLAGNAGGGGGGAGGTGGNGGTIFLIYHSLSNTGTIQELGGSGGTGGNGVAGVGTGTAGGNGGVGTAGSSGVTVEIQV